MAATAKKSAFARMQGWRPSYVTQLGKEGRLVLNDRGEVLIDETLALIQRTAAGTHPHVAARWGRRRAASAASQSATGEALAGIAPADTAKPGSGKNGAGGNEPPAPVAVDDGRAAVRKLREIVGREARLIELGVLKGELVERAAVNHLWHDVGVAARANLEAMTERLAPLVSGAANADSMAVALALAIRDENRRARKLLIGALRDLRRDSRPDGEGAR